MTWKTQLNMLEWKSQNNLTYDSLHLLIKSDVIWTNIAQDSVINAQWLFNQWIVIQEMYKKMQSIDPKKKPNQSKQGVILDHFECISRKLWMLMFPSLPHNS